MYQQGRLSGRTSPAAQQGRLSGRTSPATQQGRLSGRMSPATTCRVHDRLDALFNQLKDGLKMVEADELVELLEELLDRLDSRMVARYGHGMQPCPNADCPHQYEDCGRLSTRSTETSSRRSPEPRAAPTGDQSASSTRENARKIVINAVTNALVQASTEPATQSSSGGKAYTTRTNYGTTYTTSGQTRTSGTTRQDDYSRQTYGGIRPPTKARDITERDILAMQTIDAGESESNRAFVLRREARDSLGKYSRRPDALLHTMPQVASQNDDMYYDASETSAKSKSSKNTRQESRTYETSRSEPSRREERSDESRGSQYQDWIDQTISVSSKQPSAQTTQNVFSVAKTTPSKTFKRIQPPRVTKNESYKWDDRCQNGGKEPKEVELEKEGSDEDIWYNARDRFSSSNLIKCPLKYMVAADDDEFVPMQLRTDEKREALLRDQSTAVVPTDACTDTNLIFAVNRTLRQSLPKFTGSVRRTQGLLHLIGSVLRDDDTPADEYYPDVNYAELEDLKGDESHQLTAGDASRTYSTQQTRYTNVKSNAFRDTVQRSSDRTPVRSEYSRARQEILKVVKDSNENIKVEFNLPKEDQPQLAEFVSTFIDAQRRGQQGHQTEANTQTYGCAQCGRSFASPPIDPRGNSLTTNNNRSSKPGSPVQSFSSSQATSKSSSKGSSPRSRSPFKSVVQFGHPGYVSPTPGSPSEGYGSAHESESAHFKPSQFLVKNSMYGNKMETRVPAVEVNRVADESEPEKGKTVKNKGSFLGEICGCN